MTDAHGTVHPYHRPVDTPIAMLVFNRPAHTARVFAAIRAARPRTLMVVADGPRPDRAGEAEACRAVRSIFDSVDWPCELVRIFSDRNLGCRERIGSGITEVFSHVESCIFLEDDCLPHPSFFEYCTELLGRYALDDRVMTVSGDGFTSALGGMRFPHSYYFTRYPHIWGWATWRRAWAHYDGTMSRWPERRDSGWLRSLFPSFHDRLFWTLWFEMCHDGRLNTWDIPWVFSSWQRAGISICPSQNLVTNTGFDGTGTHVGRRSPFANLTTRAMDLPLRHPPRTEPDAAADLWTQRFCFTGTARRRWKRVLRYLRRGRLAQA